jgi:anti-sigma regulatory factor (Ser/Thr protein kinase)
MVNGWGRRRGRRTAAKGRWPAALVDAVSEGMLALDDDGTITHVSAGAATLVGRDVGELCGADVYEALPLATPDGTLYSRSDCPTLASLRPGAGRHTTSELLRVEDGSTLAIELTTAPVRDGERVVGAAVSFRPVSDASAHDGDEAARQADRERAQREFLHQLQEAVRPRQPVLDGVELGVHYLPAAEALSGGDLYDWQVLPDGDLHLLVVDVIGSGVGATKDALAVVHAVRVLVLEGCPIGELVKRVDALLSDGHPSLVATLLVGRYTPATGRMVLAGGGHPPMLLVSPDGRVQEVGAPGIPIGWPEAGSFEVVEVELDRSETAVLYTDGLIEARRDILAGLSDLKAAAAETATYPPRHLPKVLVDRALEGAERRDDTLALVLRRRAAPAGARPWLLSGFDHRFSPKLVSVPVARHLFDEWLRHQALDDPDREDLLVVASELCTNAVRSVAGSRSVLRLRSWPEGDALIVEVQDDGPGFAVAVPSADEVPALDQASGRGLFIVQSMVDELSVTHTLTGTTVRCVKRHLFAPEVPLAEPGPMAGQRSPGVL